MKVANGLDLQVFRGARKTSYDYAFLCALSLRQAFATIELTHHDKYGVQAWVKEISSDGNMLTVDIIYPMLPMLLYLCPEYIGWMMQPLLKYQSIGPVYESCAHDLGMHYPYATGPSDGSDSHMPVEESGNILIIALAHAQATGDNTLLEQYYSLLEMWTTFLMRKALIPELQLSTDGMRVFCFQFFVLNTKYLLNRLHGTSSEPVVISTKRRHRHTGNGGNSKIGRTRWRDLRESLGFVSRRVGAVVNISQEDQPPSAKLWQRD